MRHTLAEGTTPSLFFFKAGLTWPPSPMWKTSGRAKGAAVSNRNCGGVMDTESAVVYVRRT